MKLQRAFSANTAADSAKPVILATASVFPPKEYTQEDYMQRFIDTRTLTPEDEDFVRRVFKVLRVCLCACVCVCVRVCQRPIAKALVAQSPDTPTISTQPDPKQATMIETAQSYLPRDQLAKKMTRSEYVAYVRPSLLDLGLRAAKDVIGQSGVDVSQITHVVSV
jgi:hypothetical protein